MKDIERRFWLFFAFGFLMFGLVATLPFAARAEFSSAPNASTLGTDGAINAFATDGTTLYLGGAFTSFSTPTGSGNVFSTSTGALISSPIPAADGIIYAAVADGSGGWYIGGSFTKIGNTARTNLAHITSANIVDSAFDPGVINGIVNALALSGDTLYVGGEFTTINDGILRNYLAAFDATTGTATDFDPDLDLSVNILLLDGTTLYVGGEFSAVNGNVLVRNYLAAFDTNTTSTATAFDPDISSSVKSLALSGATLYVGGDFTTVNGATTRNRLAAFNTATGTVTSFDPNIGIVGNSVNELALDGTTLYAAGDFTSVNGGTVRNNLAAFDITGVGTTTDFNPIVGVAGDAVNAMVISGNNLYLGGNFTTVNGATSRQYSAAFDLTTGTATAFNPNLNSISYVMIPGPTGLFIGGDFFGKDATTRNRLAAINIASGELTSFNPNVGGVVNTLILDGTTLYAGGDFTMVNSETVREHLGAFNTASGLATDFNPDIGLGGIVHSMALSGTTLYAGGEFTCVNGADTDLDGCLGTPRNHLAAFNTATGTVTSFDPNINGTVYSLLLDGTTLYTGGSFTTVNGGATARRDLAAFNTATAVATTFDPNVIPYSPPATVYSLLLDGTTLYVGGDIASVNGGSTIRKGIAAFDTNTTSTATSFDPNLNTTSTVYSMALSGTTLYAGGEFATVNGDSTARNRLVAFDTTSTGTVTSFNPNIDNIVRALTISGTTLYAGGDFSTAGSTTTIFRFASFDGDTPANPVPTTSSISPTFRPVDDNSFTLAVTGTNFIASSVVNFNGTALTTAYVNSTKLTATVPPALIAAVAADLPITVTNPAPGGGTSNSQLFEIIARVLPSGGSWQSSSTSPIVQTQSQSSPCEVIVAQLRILIAAINALQIKLGLPPTQFNIPSCSTAVVSSRYHFIRSLSFGSRGADVSTLQEFLISQGSGIYPEALVTGYFGRATERAVQRFQDAHGIAHAGEQGYGVFGPATRGYVEAHY